MAVAERETNGLIGDIGVCLAVREAVALIFEQSPADRVVGITDARNDPSVRLLERAGMRRVASAEAVFRGEVCVEHTYAVFRHDRA